MKNLKKFIALAICAVMGASSLFAANDAEKAACREMANYIKNDLKLATEIGSEDNSVNFHVTKEGGKKKNVYYWLTFEGNATQMLFTLHRRAILNYTKPEDKNKKLVLQRRAEYATVAAEYITANNLYKAYVKGDQMEFEFPVYASNAKEYQKVFSKVLAAFGDVKATYDGNMRKAVAYVDNIHKFWMENDTAKIIVPQSSVVTRNESGRNLEYKTVSIRNVDANGSEISGYDKVMRKSEARFIQPMVTLNSTKKGTFNVGVKIKDPNGKVFVPNRDSDYTILTTIDVSKANKEQQFELPKFGINDPNKTIWKSNVEYIIEFYQDDRKIGSSTFTFL